MKDLAIRRISLARDTATTCPVQIKGEENPFLQVPFSFSLDMG